MSDAKVILAQCLDMTTLVIKTKQKAIINIRIGSDFNFEFNNMEQNVFQPKKRQSPSQAKRNFERKVKFEQQREIDNFNVNSIENHVEAKTDEIKSSIDGFKEEIIVKVDNAESQTEHFETREMGTNTSREVFDTLEDVLEVDKNGRINVLESEVIIEMKANHSFKNWEQIELHIKENLNL